MSDKRILDIITSPADLKLLSNEELSILAGEIRHEIVTTTSKTGGHVASSLGAVEIILALHSLLDCPKDKIVFDVGHQAYAHKLVTGRLKDFGTLRTYGGLSGFPKPSESPYDVHYSGHASDSLSVALGLAEARDLAGADQKVVALIGDAALSGGMAFEALNNIGQAQTPMVIILNDNEMSISHNVGALMKHLGYMRASSQYRQARDNVQEHLESSGPVGKAITNFGRSMKESMKQFVIPHSMIFEQLGIVCTAPIDGHNIAQLRETLRAVLNADGPVLMHVVTRKGQGYMPAVRNPEKFHGIAPYNIATGEVIKSGKLSAPKYTNVFGKALVAEAENNADIVAITAAMKGGTGLDEFAEKFPERFVDAGICEEHAVGFAGGLAANGKKPVVALYSTFMQRAVDQMIINVALPKLDVVFAIDRAGIVGADGPTHHGVFDLVYARMVPNMRVLAPSNEAELVHALHTALAMGGPFAIRYPRGEGEGVPLPEAAEVLPEGKGRVVREGEDVAILAFGRMVGQALSAADALAEQGVSARVVDMRWVKPLDVQAIQAAAETKLVVTVEEGVIAGGVGEGVLGEMARMGLHTPALNLGIQDAFVTQGGVGQLLHEQGLDAEGIAASVQERYRAL
ncbi:1-deoxy-D-xylulose-5-phosphate synthase [Senegalimassilia anaerobia]|uniref:1-deoxy-D-xylulose-5-phosphate synthase n=1 Tax=Senegalimassilia anaerobia TaxID=1473216 RepID=UPI003AB036AC